MRERGSRNQKLLEHGKALCTLGAKQWCMCLLSKACVLCVRIDFINSNDCARRLERPLRVALVCEGLHAPGD